MLRAEAVTLSPRHAIDRFLGGRPCCFARSALMRKTSMIRMGDVAGACFMSQVTPKHSPSLNQRQWLLRLSSLQMIGPFLG